LMNSFKYIKSAKPSIIHGFPLRCQSAPKAPQPPGGSNP
jgi:hypothetical protein